MTDNETLWYYVCDKCGSIVTIEPAPINQGEWACADCGASSMWEFTDKEKAQQHAWTIQDRVYRAEMRKLGKLA